MERKEFSEQYGKLCAAFDKEIKDGQLLVYYEYLAGLKIEAMKYAVNQAILTAKFFPKISELIDMIKEYRETVPVERQLQANTEPIVPMPQELRDKIGKEIIKRNGEKEREPFGFRIARDVTGKAITAKVEAKDFNIGVDPAKDGGDEIKELLITKNEKGDVVRVDAEIKYGEQTGAAFLAEMETIKGEALKEW